MSLYSQVLEKILLPAHNMVRGRRYVEHRRFLEESQWWPRERLLDLQWKQVRALLGHVFQSVPYYARKYADAGIRLEDIRTPSDFARLPALTREEVNAHRQELCSTNYRGKLLPHMTGGSSGTPTRFFRTIESYDWRTAATDRAYSWTGCHLGERTVYLWGAPVGRMSMRAALKKRADEFFRRQLIFSTFSQTKDLWWQIHRACLRFRPKLIVGYLSSLEEFARFLQAEKLRVSNVRAVIAAAEPVYNSSRELISAALGAPLFNTYGSREFMSIAAECDCHSGLHINCENILVETAASAQGPSDLLITDLHNYGMPFVRYAIGDAGVLDHEPCPCGRALPRLKSIDGRVLDLLRTADGRVVPGEFFPHLLKEIPEIEQYQVVQQAADRIVIRAVLSQPLSAASDALLAAEMRKVFGSRTTVQVCGVDKIERMASGKRRVTVGLA